MEKNLYIDASHPNETRVVLKSGDNIEDYEYEGLKNNLIKNNIYLGKVSRIEPSLQAAFIDFGRERHGFLSFNDIQSDYYQIPKADLDRIKEEEEKAREKLSKEVEAKEEENIAEGKLEIDDPINIEKDPAEENENSFEVITVTTNNVNLGNIYFDFLSHSEVNITDDWHMGIEIDTNNYNMPSFVPDSNLQIAVYDNMDFNDLNTLPDSYQEDVQSDHTVFGYGGSYEVLSYDITVHKVSVTNPGNIYVLKKDSNAYKMQFIEYVSGITVFRYAEINF